MFFVVPQVSYQTQQKLKQDMKKKKKLQSRSHELEESNSHNNSLASSSNYQIGNDLEKLSIHENAKLSLPSTPTKSRHRNSVISESSISSPTNHSIKSGKSVGGDKPKKTSQSHGLFKTSLNAPLDYNNYAELNKIMDFNSKLAKRNHRRNLSIDSSLHNQPVQLSTRHSINSANSYDSKKPRDSSDLENHEASRKENLYEDFDFIQEYNYDEDYDDEVEVPSDEKPLRKVYSNVSSIFSTKDIDSKLSSPSHASGSISSMHSSPKKNKSLKSKFFHK